MLYHLVPDGGAINHILVSLNRLREVDHETYMWAMKKYERREDVPRREVPLLNCTWGDTINLSAVHPHELKQTLLECGVDTGSSQAYVIDPYWLDLSRLAVYDFDQSDFGAVGTYQAFERRHMKDEEAGIGEATKSYFRRSVTWGERPFRFLGIRHFLYKGEINVKDLPVVNG